MKMAFVCQEKICHLPLIDRQHERLIFDGVRSKLKSMKVVERTMDMGAAIYFRMPSCGWKRIS
jgi:hypothetical protein